MREQLLRNTPHNRAERSCLSPAHSRPGHQTKMSTMNDVHQFRVRTPSFLISADVPVQVRTSRGCRTDSQLSR